MTVDIEPEFDIPKYEEFELSINQQMLGDDVEKEINALWINEHPMRRWIVQFLRVTMLNVLTKAK